jgi:thiol:disulfide interchange protein
MKRFQYFSFSVMLLATLACSLISLPQSSNALSSSSTLENASHAEESALVNVYDPARDPADDLQQAIALAQKENKRIMLELGGDWCIWCKYMDDFYATHADILKARAENYVLVKVNVSDENMNEKFLSQFPEVGGYPHIYILESDGTFLHSQDTVELEDGNISYVPEVFIAFLQKWAPQQ